MGTDESDSMLEFFLSLHKPLQENRTPGQSHNLRNNQQPCSVLRGLKGERQNSLFESLSDFLKNLFARNSLNFSGFKIVDSSF